MVEVALTNLWLPIVLSAVVLFFIGFITHMVLPLHKPDWKPLPDEEAFRSAVRGLNIPTGNYMVPYCADAEQMKSEAFLRKQEEGPVGIVQLWQEGGGMGKQLACQFVYLLLASYCLAYLATLGLKPGEEAFRVFRFVGTAAILVYILGLVPFAIWFRTRIAGYVIDGILYGLATGLIFALLWPGGPTAG